MSSNNFEFLFSWIKDAIKIVTGFKYEMSLTSWAESIDNLKHEIKFNNRPLDS